MTAATAAAPRQAWPRVTRYPDLPALPPRPETGRHRLGLCGGPAMTCAACISEDAAALIAWAQTAPAPFPGEDLHTYWRRLSDDVQAHNGGSARGLWVDAWDVASAAIMRSMS